jgi:hypothetical protein
MVVRLHSGFGCSSGCPQYVELFSLSERQVESSRTASVGALFHFLGLTSFKISSYLPIISLKSGYCDAKMAQDHFEFCRRYRRIDAHLRPASRCGRTRIYCFNCRTRCRLRHLPINRQRSGVLIRLPARPKTAPAVTGMAILSRPHLIHEK